MLSPAATSAGATVLVSRHVLSPCALAMCAADVDGALAALQWVLSAKPDAAVAEQQLQAALKLVRADRQGWH